MGVIRRIRKIMVGLNPNDHIVNNLGGTGEVHNLSDQDDSLESVYFEEAYSHHCGCFGEPGGRCSECGAVSCICCHRHCGGSDNQTHFGCGKPLCREHSHYVMLEGGVSIPFCQQCFSELGRKRQRMKVAKFLLRPLTARMAGDD